MLYLLRGTSTDSYCPGFNQRVYVEFGIKLGRTTYAQVKNGVDIAGSDYITERWTK